MAGELTQSIPEMNAKRAKILKNVSMAQWSCSRRPVIFRLLMCTPQCDPLFALSGRPVRDTLAMSRFFTFTLSLSLAAGLAMPARAATECPEHFAGGVAPTITNPKLKARTQEVCFEAFAVLHSGISRTPLYSAEHLTRANLNAAGKLSRKDSFHPESALPAQDRAELKDYARSGYDRGHMQYPVKSILIDDFPNVDV